MHDDHPSILSGLNDHKPSGVNDHLPLLGSGVDADLTPTLPSTPSASPSSSVGLGSGGGDGRADVTANREGNFSRKTGRFRDPLTGSFEAGSAPPDLDTGTNRYRGKNGQFKTGSADLYDEPEEVALNSLDPMG